MPRFVIVVNGTEFIEVMNEDELRTMIAAHRAGGHTNTIAVYGLQSAEQRETTFKSLI